MIENAWNLKALKTYIRKLKSKLPKDSHPPLYIGYESEDGLCIYDSGNRWIVKEKEKVIYKGREEDTACMYFLERMEGYMDSPTGHVISMEPERGSRFVRIILKAAFVLLILLILTTIGKPYLVLAITRLLKIFTVM